MYQVYKVFDARPSIGNSLPIMALNGMTAAGALRTVLRGSWVWV